MIPRILHRVVPAQPPEEAERFWQNLRDLHPGWEMRSWVDRQNANDFELGVKFDLAKSGAQLADLVRLEVLWRHGGVYVDSDCEPVRSFEGLLNEELFIATEDGQHLTNAVIGCRPGHPGIRACMDAILSEGRVELDAPPNESTGPYLVTAVLAGRHDVTVLPPEFFFPYPHNSARPSQLTDVTTKHTVVVHHWAGSWKTSKPKSTPALREFPARVTSKARGTARRLGEPMVARLRTRCANATFLGDGRVLVALPDGSSLFCLADDLSLTPELAAQGIYDRRYWEFLGRLLKPGDRVIEVGANIGLFTVRMARLIGRFGHLDAFEADPTLAQLVQMNLTANWLTESAAVHQLAIAETNGTSRFRSDPSSRMLGHLSTDGDLEVRVRRLDSVVRSDLPIHLLKVDVEGAEASVLEGAEALLRSGAVRVIDIEVVRNNAGGDWLRLCELMRRLVAEHHASVATLNADGSERPTTIDSVIARAGHFPHVIFRLP